MQKPVERTFKILILKLLVIFFVFYIWT